jgi:hydroxyethylthiazole kinase-like sugar kinase family protein
MSLSKDQTLTVVVTGKEEQVKKARREVMTKLQTQVLTYILAMKCISILFLVHEDL